MGSTFCLFFALISPRLALLTHLRFRTDMRSLLGYGTRSVLRVALICLSPVISLFAGTSLSTSIPEMSGADFTIVALPDTQFYVSTLNGGSPAIFNNQTDWI